MAHFTSGHALLIGIGEYQCSKWNAPVTMADAQAMADALIDSNIAGYPSDQVELLSKSQATRDGVAAAIQRLADRTQPSDTVVMFFCGHGALGTDGVYYFATHEAEFEHGRVLAGTGLSSPDLLDLLRKVKAKKLLFIINACFSGHISPSLGSTDGSTEVLGAPPSAMLAAEILASGEGRALITASRPSQYSYYHLDQAHTFFGQALIDGLRGKAINSDGYIGLYELYQYIYTHVRDAAAQTNDTQEPVLTILQNVGPFPVALAPEARSVNLGAIPIQQNPPADTAVDILPRPLVQAIGQGAQAFSIQSAGSVVIDQSRKLIDMGKGNQIGSVQIGDVAAGNIIKIDVKVTASDAATPNTKQEWLDLIAKLQSDVSEQLTAAPKGKRQDAEDELRKAKAAGEEGDKERLLEKLDSAQKILFAMGSNIPAALKLGETISVLLQRAMSLFR